jgi:hypothetical protein
MIYKLSDEVITQIAKLVQIGILTGTDVVDNLRMLEVTTSESNSDNLVLSEEYRDRSESHIEKLMSEVAPAPDSQ